MQRISLITTQYLTILWLSTSLYAQPFKPSIRFQPMYNGQVVELAKKYPYQNDSIQFNTLKFYIGNIQFYNGAKPIGTIAPTYHLVDLDKPSSLLIYNNQPVHQSITAVQFTLGVDSLTNVSGAMAGDLDPINGMYWAWQSGYIHFKLEGSSLLCAGRKNQFIFHIGGYQTPFNSVTTVTLQLTTQKEVLIGINLSQLMKQIHLHDLYEVMRPGEKSLYLSHLIQNTFAIHR